MQPNWERKWSGGKGKKGTSSARILFSVPTFGGCSASFGRDDSMRTWAGSEWRKRKFQCCSYSFLLAFLTQGEVRRSTIIPFSHLTSLCLPPHKSLTLMSSCTSSFPGLACHKINNAISMQISKTRYDTGLGYHFLGLYLLRFPSNHMKWNRMFTWLNLH